MKMRIYSLTLLAAILLIALIACGKGGPAESGLSKGETGKVSASHRPGHGGGGGGGGDDGGGGGGGGGTPGPGDWNQYGHDSRHSGRSAFAGPDSPMLKFAYQLSKIASALHGVTFGSDGTAYFGHDDGYLYALNPVGTLKWKLQLASLVRSTPAIGQDGTIFVSAGKNFYAVNPNGVVKWSFSTGDSFSWTPTIGTDGTIYLPGGQFLYAFYPDGSLKWSLDLRSESCETNHPPAIGSDGTIYAGITMDAYQGGILAINSDGEPLWLFVTDLAARPPVIGENDVVYCSGTQVLFALNSDGTVLWTFNHDFSAFPVWGRKAVGADGTLYYSYGNEFVALNPDGTEKWSHSFGAGFSANSVVVDSSGTVYVGTRTDSDRDGRVFAFRPDGSVKWSFLTNGSRPGGLKGGTVGPVSIAQDGSIYFLCTDWRLYALGPGAG